MGVSVGHPAIQLATVTLNSNPHILFKIRFTFIPHSANDCGRTYRHGLPTVTKSVYQSPSRTHYRHSVSRKVIRLLRKEISITIFLRIPYKCDLVFCTCYKEGT